MFLLLVLDYWLIKAEMETHPVTTEAKLSICSIWFKSAQAFFVLFTHYIILSYFFKETIPCFVYIFRSKFLAYVFFHHIFFKSSYIFIGKIYHSFILLIKPIIFDISIDSSSLNIFFIITDRFITNNRKD